MQKNKNDYGWQESQTICTEPTLIRFTKQNKFQKLFSKKVKKTELINEPDVQTKTVDSKGFYFELI